MTLLSWWILDLFFSSSFLGPGRVPPFFFGVLCTGRIFRLVVVHLLLLNLSQEAHRGLQNNPVMILGPGYGRCRWYIVLHCHFVDTHCLYILFSSHSFNSQTRRVWVYCCLLAPCSTSTWIHPKSWSTVVSDLLCLPLQCLSQSPRQQNQHCQSSHVIVFNLSRQEARRAIRGSSSCLVFSKCAITEGWIASKRVASNQSESLPHYARIDALNVDHEYKRHWVLPKSYLSHDGWSVVVRSSRMGNVQRCVWRCL